MLTSPRILRAEAERFEPTLFELTPRQQARHDRIIRAGRFLLARFGRGALTFANLAVALRLAPGTLRFHFVDLDALLACLLRTHLENVAAALAKIPPDAPDRARKLRAAYIAATRTAEGTLTADHIILVRDLGMLPPDEYEPIEALRGQIGETLADEHGLATLAVLDMDFPPDKLEAPVQAIQAAADAPIVFPNWAPAPAPLPPQLPPNEFLAFGPSGLRVARTEPPPDLPRPGLSVS